MSRVVGAAIVIGGGLVCLARPAHAYLDPGTWSMLVQTFIAAVGAVSVIVAVSWRRVKEFIRGLLSRQASKEGGSAADGDR